MDYYWELILKDDTRIEVPPSGIPVIQKRMDERQPIHTAKSGSIPFAEIKIFRPTDKAYGQVPLLDAAAQAFGEPQINPDGSIRSKWVKKKVTQRDYAKHFAPLPAYIKLGEEGHLVTVAFRLPVHEIDTALLTYCSDEETRRLNR